MTAQIFCHKCGNMLIKSKYTFMEIKCSKCGTRLIIISNESLSIIGTIDKISDNEILELEKICNKKGVNANVGQLGRAEPAKCPGHME